METTSPRKEDKRAGTGDLKQEAVEQETVVPDQKRSPGRKGAILISSVAVVWAIFQLFATVSGTVSAMHLRGWHIVFLVLLAFLIFRPFRANWTHSTIVSAVDLILAIIATTPFLYFVLNYERIALRGGFLEPLDYGMGILGVVVAMEVARRVVRNLAILAGLFLAYAFIGQYISGTFGHAGYTLDRLTQQLFWGSQGLFGIAIGVSATFVFIFIVFGAFLKNSGFSDFVSDVALAIAGQSPGGPAKVAVIASAMTGTINGSALANVATTGSITIPLMKNYGYRPRMAAAVEAVASTGGQFAPPVMGAVGFVMAEYLGLPYATVMVAAAVPAGLYFLALMLVVHFEAKRQGLSGISRENLPRTWAVIKQKGHLSLPLIILVALLLAGFTPLFAGVIGIIATVLASWIRPSTRMGLKDTIHSLDEGARSAIGVGVACLVIGVIIGIVSLTGLGLNLGFFIANFAGESILIPALLVMIMSIILGMGVPGVAAYVIVAAVGAPILLDAGLEPLVAHMFILFYASLSNITPPVALASYIAAGIAQTDETKASLTAVRVGLVGFILPFMFIYNPGLLLDPSDLIASVGPTLTAIIAIPLITGSLQGWLIVNLTRTARLLLFAAGLVILAPGVASLVAGAALASVAATVQLLVSRKSTDRN